jgi:hypothetical protein
MGGAGAVLPLGFGVGEGVVPLGLGVGAGVPPPAFGVGDGAPLAVGLGGVDPDPDTSCAEVPTFDSSPELQPVQTSEARTIAMEAARTVFMVGILP